MIKTNKGVLSINLQSDSYQTAGHNSMKNVFHGFCRIQAEQRKGTIKVSADNGHRVLK